MTYQRPGKKETFLGLILLAVTAYGWLNLPDQIAIHFNAAGQPNNIVAKNLGLAILPLMTAGLYTLFRYLPEIDPLGENIKEFQKTYENFTLTILGFTTYIQATVVAWNLGYTFDVSQALAPGIAALYFLMGDVLQKAERNWFIGIRNPWTLSSEEVWDKTHRQCGPLFKIAALPAVAAVFLPEYFIFLIVFPVAFVAAYSTGFSFYQYRKTE